MVGLRRRKEAEFFLALFVAASLFQSNELIHPRDPYVTLILVNALMEFFFVCFYELTEIKVFVVIAYAFVKRNSRGETLHSVALQDGLNAGEVVV